MASPANLARSSITACRRCRQRKQKCDQRLPQCRSCEKAGLECVGYDAVTKRNVPRSYVHSLEERVAFLELRLQSHGIPIIGDAISARPETVQDEQPDHTDESASNETPAEVNVQIPTSLASEKIRQANIRDANFTRFLLADLHKAEATFGLLPLRDSAHCSDGFVGFEMPKISDTAPVSLPERPIAEQLAKVYFEFSNFSVPFLHETTFRRKLDHVYNSADPINPKDEDIASKRAYFFTYMVLTIGLLILQKHDATDIPPSQCERYYTSALRCLETVGLPADVESVQTLLLIAQYSCFRPNFFGIYKTVGMAMRMAVELGLNQDLPQCEGDPLTVDTRRRVFWSAYALDRHIGTIFGKPFCLEDGAINVEFPSPHNDEYITENGINADESVPLGKKAFGVHYFRYRRLQSEIQVILRQRKPDIYAPIDYLAWQEDMHRRLSEWLSSAPKDTSPSIIAPIETLQGSYLQGRLHLFRPSLNIPNPAGPALVTLAKTASTMIEHCRRIHRENKVRMFWITFHNIFRAGVTLLDCFSHSPEVRNQIPLREIEKSIHACSAVMWGMVERFPAAKVKRDAFEAFASASLDAAATLVAATPINTAPNDVSTFSIGNNLLPGWSNWETSTAVIGDEVATAHSGVRAPGVVDELSTSLSSYWMPASESFFDSQTGSWNDPDIEWMNSGPNPTFFSNVI